jgi:hypothetical protein
MRQKYYYYDQKNIFAGYLCATDPEYKEGAAVYVSKRNTQQGVFGYCLFLSDLSSDILNSREYNYCYASDVLTDLI